MAEQQAINNLVNNVISDFKISDFATFHAQLGGIASATFENKVLNEPSIQTKTKDGKITMPSFRMPYNLGIGLILLSKIFTFLHIIRIC